MFDDVAGPMRFGRRKAIAGAAALALTATVSPLRTTGAQLFGDSETPSSLLGELLALVPAEAMASPSNAWVDFFLPGVTLDALWPPPIRAAVEMAAWDLLGRVLRQPLCNLLGGFYRRRIPVSVRLEGCGCETAANESRELAEQGFHTITVAGSGNPDDDAAAVKAIRELLGDRITLRLDGQGLYDFEVARDICAELEYEGLQYFLDPIKTAEIHPSAVLGRQTNVPLALWRSIRAGGDVFAAARCGAAPFVVIDLEQLGGIAPAKACAAVACAAGIIPVLGCRASSGVSTAAMLHLAASTPAISIANEIAPCQLRDSVLADSPEIVEGMILVPESPGLGVEVDRSKLERRRPIV